MERKTLINELNSLLNAQTIKDYCPNGLQVEGTKDIRRIVTGVTASKALIQMAIDKKADAVLVHHGYFWKGEDPTITGMKFERIKCLIENDINLIAFHLPIDVHAQYGNNVQLGQLFGIQRLAPIETASPLGVLYQGEFEQTLTVNQLAKIIETKLKRSPLVVDGGNGVIKKVAWCTGGGQGYIEQALEAGVDAFITGEVSEQTVHVARECGIHFFAAGHHATERYGVKAVGEYLNANFDLAVEFIDIDNPA